MSRPDPSPRRPLRRALAAAAVLLVGAVAAHAAAGGPLPSLAALVVPAGLMVAIGTVLTAGRPPRWVSLALVSGSQYVVHGLLVLSASHVHHLAPGGASPGIPTGARPTSSDAAMLAMHAAATLAVALLLAQGDRVLGWLAAVLRPVWQPRAVTVQPVGRPLRTPLVHAPLVVPAARRCVTARPRRGPPRGTGVAPAVTA